MFVQTYQVQIGMNYIRCRPWVDFVELCKKYKLESAIDVLGDRFMVYKLILAHKLNSNSHFKSNMEHLIGTSNVVWHELQSSLLISILQSLHDFYRDDGEFEELFHFSVPTIDSVTDHFAIDAKQYANAVQVLDVSVTQTK